MATSRPPSRTASSSRVSSPAPPQSGKESKANEEATAQGSEEDGAAPPLPEIHVEAQTGNAERIHQLIHEEGIDPNARDSQNITPLHWAAINNRLLACKELLVSGAQVDAIGGELQASPLQWAARNGHVDVCHLLIYHGADAAIKDLQGFNTLHLAVHSSNAILVLYILSQQLPLSLDEPDAAGRTALAWAAYQGDGISVDLLLRFGTDPNKADPGGLTPLHWAVVKGNVNCISRIVKHGSDLTRRNNDGITPMELSKQLNSINAFQRAMKSLGRFPDGRLKSPTLSLKHTKWATFVMPTVMIYLAFKTLDLLPWYTASLLVVGEMVGCHHVVTRVLADGHPRLDGMMSPYLAGIVAGSLFWVAYAWLTTLVGATSVSFPGTNFVFVLAFVLCSYNLLRAITLDPGYVPLYASKTQLKDVVEDLVSAGRFSGQEFCVTCMVRKPIRSKHCKICERCVGKHDHHCPWIFNCVGVDNHRQFLLFVLNLVVGVIAFDRLAIAYYSQLPGVPEEERELTCLFPRPICEASHIDTFTFATACWATLQLTWTSFVTASHSYQVTRQLTTLELSNLGRYGYMGGRPMATPPNQQAQPSACGHDHGSGGHHHHHNKAGSAFKRLLSLLGLDLYTKGKAAEGIKTSASEQGQKLNPFDVGVWRNCTDFWSRGKTLGVDYTSLYEIPEGGFKAQLASRRQEGTRDKKAARRGGGRYEMVSQVEDV